MDIWLGTFRHNCIWGQLKNEGGGELHEIKQRQNENKQRNNMIMSKGISFEGTRSNIFVLKCVSITNISVKHYMEGVISYEKMKTFFERLYWVAFQFLIQKYYTWQNNTFWCGIINTK